jgi:hypothetical protein
LDAIRKTPSQLVGVQRCHDLDFASFRRRVCIARWVATFKAATLLPLAFAASARDMPPSFNIPIAAR